MTIYRYRTIVADPPWDVRAGPAQGAKRTLTGSRSLALPYPRMSLSAIKALPVSGLAEPDAHLYLWTINKYVEDAYDVVRAWGFRPGMLLVWAKTPKGRGLGDAWATTTEYVLTARRGSLAHTGRVERNWWNWPRGEHSRKPEAFLDLVEQVSPGPFLELFSRRARLGWDTWGDEALGGLSLLGGVA